MKDFIISFQSVSQWWLLAWFDIKQAYRRSVLGPFWITISNAVLIIALVVLWINVFNIPLVELLPFFAIGHIIWVFIGTQINEACISFNQFESHIRQLNLPSPIYILRVWARNVIHAAHNLIIILAIMVYFQFSWVPFILEAMAGAILVCLFLFFLSVPIAYLCARFRDIPLIIQNGIQIMYFLTPIIWKPNMLPNDKIWFTTFNPFFHLIEVIRAPLLGEHADISSWAWVLSMLIICALLALLTHARCHKQLAYWM